MQNLKSDQPWGIHWFRRDLRIAGNQALRENFKKTNGRTLGLFCFDSVFLARSDFSSNRFAFFLETLQSLKHELHAQGGDLLVVDSQPLAAFERLFAFFDGGSISRPNIVSFGRDYEPYARKRDQDLTSWFLKNKTDIICRRDHLIIEPEEIKKDDGGFYQIYTPFSRRWFALLQSKEGQLRIESQSQAEKYYNKFNSRKCESIFNLKWSVFQKDVKFPFQDSLDVFKTKNNKKVTIPIPDAGFQTAYRKLIEFKTHISSYLECRDLPSVPGTSKLSIYLKNGSLTSSQIFQALDLNYISPTKKNGEVQFAKEIVWREFYYSILFHRPEVEKESFLKQYENLAWQNNFEWLERWKSGTTGFPIVDAGMRELNSTGLMHNRVRMIVASFLTKDLLMDWRMGENYFMKMLLDGDLAPNNGGWQWAASTGCDPQPYFRVFNPWLQSEKFDPNGTYIKKFVPELRSAPSKILHQADADRSTWKYPSPVVDHSVQREKAIALYKSTNHRLG